jgi:hypothetical protein
MAQEKDVARAIMRIAASQENGVCSYKRAYTDLPGYVHLSPANLAPSQTRRREPMWHQLVRNIKSHDKAFGNFIEEGLLVHVPKVGYRITERGRKTLN